MCRYVHTHVCTHPQKMVAAKQVRQILGTLQRVTTMGGVDGDEGLMLRLLERMDSNGDGELSREELAAGCKDSFNVELSSAELDALSGPFFQQDLGACRRRMCRPQGTIQRVLLTVF